MQELDPASDESMLCKEVLLQEINHLSLILFLRLHKRINNNEDTNWI